MALTTLTTVLTYLGLDDDSVTPDGIIVAMDAAELTNLTVAINSTSTTCTVTPTPGSPTAFTLTAAAYDTLTELADGIAALSGILAYVPQGVDGSTASTMLSPSQSIALTSTADAVSDGLTLSEAMGETDGSLIESMILRAEDAIGRHCNRIDANGAQTFESGSRDEYYDGDGGEILLLRNAPVSSITSIATVASDGTNTTIDSTAYRLVSRTGQVIWNGAGLTLRNVDSQGFEVPKAGPDYFRTKIGWPRGTANIRVQYTGGFSTVPDDLAGIATDVVVEMYLNRRTNQSAALQSIGGFSTAYRGVGDLVRKRAAQLAPYVWYGGACA